MKQVFLSVVLLLLLTGCSLAPDTYLSVEEHSSSSGHARETQGVTAGDYQELKRAILYLVETGQTQGTIRVNSYEGDLEEDLTRAAYEVSKLNPIGAYAVDYMTHNCVFIVNYYEISIQTTFRRTVREIESIEPIATWSGIQDRLRKAVAQGESRVTMRLSNNLDRDFEAVILQYCADHPDTVMETPEVSVNYYPDTGTVRVVEINLDYTLTEQEREEMAAAVSENVSSAAEYIRYRQSDREKVQLLFTYLTERFHYEPGVSRTPVYAALCQGIADPVGLARAFQLICDRAGVECYTVEGLNSGQAYLWNVVSDDGLFRHVDLARCILEDQRLVLRADTEMSRYYWDPDQVPACILLPETPVPTEPQQSADSQTAGESPSNSGTAEPLP